MTRITPPSYVKQLDKAFKRSDWRRCQEILQAHGVELQREVQDRNLGAWYLLRKGQVSYELGDVDQARPLLKAAFRKGGFTVFGKRHNKYLDAIASYTRWRTRLHDATQIVGLVVMILWFLTSILLKKEGHPQTGNFFIGGAFGVFAIWLYGRSIDPYSSAFPDPRVAAGRKGIASGVPGAAGSDCGEAATSTGSDGGGGD